MCDKILCGNCMEFFMSCASCEECEALPGDKNTFELELSSEGKMLVYTLDHIFEEEQY
jgi:hypothetical protein